MLGDTQTFDDLKRSRRELSRSYRVYISPSILRKVLELWNTSLTMQSTLVAWKLIPSSHAAWVSTPRLFRCGLLHFRRTWCGWHWTMRPLSRRSTDNFCMLHSWLVGFVHKSEHLGIRNPSSRFLYSNKCSHESWEAIPRMGATCKHPPTVGERFLLHFGSI